MAFNSAVVLSFSILLTFRILTEFPRVLEETGWLHNNVSENFLNRGLSGLLLAFCLFFVFLKNRISFPGWFQVLTFILGTFLILSLLRAMSTFHAVGMPATGIFIVASRFVFEWAIVIFILNYVCAERDAKILFSNFYNPTLALLVICGFAQIITSKQLVIQGIERVTGPFGSPNTFAGVLHLFIALSFYRYAGNRRIRFWVIIGLQYILLFSTGSVATLLANFVFILLLAIKEKWYKLKSFYALIPVVVPAIIAWTIYQWDYVLKRLSILFRPGSFQLTPGSSLAWRLQAWKQYISLLGDDISNWLLGLGIGTQRFILLHDYPGNLAYKFEAPGTHNDYLAVLVDFGLLGLTIFFIILYHLHRMIRKMEQSDRKLRYVRLYLYSVLVIMLSENYLDQLIMFIFLAMTFTLIRSNATYQSKGWVVAEPLKP